MRSRLLLVDDDRDVLDSLELVLSERYDVELALHGEEALAKLAARRFDLVVLDLMMPVCDGAGVIAGMRARGDTTPVLLASADLDLARRCVELGAAGAIAKPFRLEELEARIESLLAGGPGSPGSPSGGGQRTPPSGGTPEARAAEPATA